ncbi:RNA 2',3'-cyclic phosphodiesterase [Cellulomonas iranensis]|uniref:RNA 2',3'-cyclic phosphodiesterase n=1 Tax=Cellulomonas iranensis TaxID=76862 RepID=UPI001CF3F363|nr:RNA 2',3'-cyclic phosphodiesterase [Cellulomonas iranensis]UCN13293.1 RNA 2',3'-cyclic phosphodiesterase [Cellulomonas iranensis]
MRLFAAVWPPDDVLDHLDLALGAVRARSGPDDAVRWTARDAWHLTSAFYGTLPDAVVDALGADLAAHATALAPFDLRLAGAGAFAHRTLWVGAGGDVAAATALAAAARAAGDAHGAPPDPRVRHRPHLTVGRVRPAGRPARHRGTPPGARGPGRDRARSDDPGPAETFVQALAVYQGPVWTVDEITLVESRPGEGRGGGPLYTPLARCPLGR